MDEKENNSENGVKKLSYEVWINERIKNIEYLFNTKKGIHFKILDIKENGFLVKVEGLHSFISFHHMPWVYKDVESWSAVFPSLTNKYFFCKIYDIKREVFKFIIDGGIPQFKEPFLIPDIEYTGIIIKKTDTYLLVDIGVNFYWDCGSIVGLLSKFNFNFSKHNPDYNIGNEIKVKYDGVNEKGYIILKKESDTTFWLSETAIAFLGQKVSVRINKFAKSYYDLWVNEKYKAVMPINKDIYGIQTEEISILNDALTDGDILDCIILSVNKQLGFFTLKWLAPIAIYDIWYSDEVNELIGETVDVHVYKDNKAVNLKVINKYKAVLPIDKMFYPDTIDKVYRYYRKLVTGSIIKCEIYDVNRNSGFFILKWDVNAGKSINWESVEIEKLVGTAVIAKLLKKVNNFEFKIDDVYDARLPIDSKIYTEEKNLISKYINSLNLGDLIECEVISVNKNKEYLNIKLSNYRAKVKWGADEVKNLVGKNTWVRISKDDTGETAYLVNNKYKGIIHIIDENDIAYTEILNQEISKLENNQIIECKIEAVNIIEGYFVLIWRFKGSSTILLQHSKIIDLIGCTVNVRVDKSNMNIDFFIDNKYKAVLPITTEIYSEYQNAAICLINGLHDGEILDCTILGVDKENANIILKWNFVESIDIDWLKPSVLKMLGQKINVKVIKRSDADTYFLIKNKYKAILPISKEIYKSNIDFIKDKFNYLVDDSTIECKIISLNLKDKLFIIKFIDDDINSINWFSSKIDALVGTIVKVPVKREKDILEFKINDIYKALMPLNYKYYNNLNKVINKYYYDLKDGEIIDCEILSVDKFKGHFIIKWLNEYELDHKVLSNEIEHLLDTIVKVRVIDNGKSKFSFMIEDKYAAELPITKAIYKNNYDTILKKYNDLKNDSIINCKIETIDNKNKIIVLKWLLAVEETNIWESNELLNLIGKIVSVNVIIKNNRLHYFINGKYKAILPVKREYYPNNYDTLIKFIKESTINRTINCEVIGVNKVEGYFTIKWIIPNLNNINWFSPDIAKFYQEMVWVRVVKSTNKTINFLVHDIYNAKMPLKTKIYPDCIEIMNVNYSKLKNNEIIKCRIIDINVNEGCFILKWVIPPDKGIDWNTPEVEELIDKTVSARFNKNKNNINFSVNNKYRAIMPLTKKLYPAHEFDLVKTSYNKLTEGSKLKSKILSVNKEEGYFVIQWIANDTHFQFV